jgi:hypothetical protein
MSGVQTTRAPGGQLRRERGNPASAAAGQEGDVADVSGVQGDCGAEAGVLSYCVSVQDAVLLFVCGAVEDVSV